jgi:hypothetical protein
MLIVPERAVAIEQFMKRGEFLVAILDDVILSKVGRRKAVFLAVETDAKIPVTVFGRNVLEPSMMQRIPVRA